TIAPLFFLFRAVTVLPIALRRKIPFKQWMTSTLFRFALGALSPRHIQAVVPSTVETYAAWIRTKEPQEGFQKLQLKAQTVPLHVEPAASILWLGDPSRATKFVLFFHGGGYVVPLHPGHLDWCWNGYVSQQEPEGSEKGPRPHEVAVAILQYSLSPGAKYPTQQRQAVAALDYLLGRGIAPRDVIVGGDSAGGNLTVQLLHHLAHRRQPGTPPLGDPAAARFAGIFLVSPWVSGHHDTVSYRDNGAVDMLSAPIVAGSTAHVLGSVGARESGAHPALPLDGNLGWLGAIQRLTGSLYVTCGYQEVFRDDILSFAEAVRLRNPGLDVKVDVGAREVHDAILLEGAHAVVGDATRRMRAWASSQLQEES
ncbi:Alpha/Beta hydrolase protein, partial [Microdochium trichocladiopsis]